MSGESATILNAVAAIAATGCAAASFRLAYTIYREAKADERLIFGPLGHPREETVTNADHRHAVLGCVVFNKARRKAFIKEVVAFDGKKSIPITWSDSIDENGNLGDRRRLIGVVDSTMLYVRRNDGSLLAGIQLKVTHSFSDSPQIVEHDVWDDE